MKTTRKAMSIVLCIAVMLSVCLMSGTNAIAADPANLLVNGDFSDGTNGWVISQKDGTNQGGQYQDDTLGNCLQLFWNANATQTVNLTPNTVYDLSFKTKRGVGRNDASSVKISVIKGDTELTSTSVQSDSWVARIIRFATGEDADDIVIRLEGQGGCNSWFNSVTLTENDGNLLINGDFRISTSEGSVPGWNLNSAATWTNNKDVSDVPVLNVWGANKEISQTVTLEANTAYVMGFEGFSFKGGGSATLTVTDGDRNILGSKTFTYYEFTHMEFFFTTGENTKITVAFKISDGTYSHYFRNLDLREKEDYVNNGDFSERGSKNSDGTAYTTIPYWTTGGKAVYRTDEDAVNLWSYGTMYQEIELKTNTKYVLSYNARAITGTDVVVSVVDGEGNALVSSNPGTEYKDHALIFKTNENVDGLKVNIYGGMTDGAYIKYVEIKAISSIEYPENSKVLNGSFADGDLYWSTDAAITNIVCDDVSGIRISWGKNVNQMITLEPHRVYVLSFTSRCENGSSSDASQRRIEASIKSIDGSVSVVEETVSTDYWLDKKVTFVTDSQTPTDALVNFYVTGDNYFLANVSISEVANLEGQTADIININPMVKNNADAISFGTVIKNKDYTEDTTDFGVLMATAKNLGDNELTVELGNEIKHLNASSLFTQALKSTGGEYFLVTGLVKNIPAAHKDCVIVSRAYVATEGESGIEITYAAPVSYSLK